MKTTNILKTDKHVIYVKRINKQILERLQSMGHIVIIK